MLMKKELIENNKILLWENRKLKERIDNTIEYINNSIFFYQNKDIKRDLLLLLSGIIVRSDKEWMK